MVTWALSRHVFYGMVCWSVYHDSPQILKSDCYRGAAGNLEGPLPVPQGWSYLLEPFQDPTGLVCSSDNIMLGFLFYLLFLEVIMFMWFAMIIKVAIRVLNGSGAEDVRSDDEAEEEVDHFEEPRPIEEEVGVEDIDFGHWQRRTGIKKTTGSTSISLPGHSDRKEILNRIGCEKQID